MDALKFQLVHHDTFIMAKFNNIAPNVSWLKPNSGSTTYPAEAFLSDILFSFVFDKYIVCDVCELRSPHLSLVVWFILHLLIHSPCKTLYCEACNKNHKNLVLDVRRTFGTSNKTIYYHLQNICFTSYIDLDTLTIMSPKIDVPYLWIRPLCVDPLNLVYGLL